MLLLGRSWPLVVATLGVRSTAGPGAPVATRARCGCGPPGLMLHPRTRPVAAARARRSGGTGVDERKAGGTRPVRAGGSRPSSYRVTPTRSRYDAADGSEWRLGSRAESARGYTTAASALRTARPRSGSPGWTSQPAATTRPSALRDREPESPRPGRSVGRRFRTGLIVASALVLVLNGTAWGLYHDITAGITTTDVIAGGSDSGPQDILIVGVDSRTDAQGNPLPPDVLSKLNSGPDTGVLNSDTIILLHVPEDGGPGDRVLDPARQLRDHPGVPPRQDQRRLPRDEGPHGRAAGRGRRSGPGEDRRRGGDERARGADQDGGGPHRRGDRPLRRDQPARLLQPDDRHRRRRRLPQGTGERRAVGRSVPRRPADDLRG